MFCVKCGTQLPDDAAFCSKCGTKVAAVAAAAPRVRATSLSRDVPIYIHVPDDRQGQIAKALSDSLVKAGFRTTKDSTAADGLLDVSLYLGEEPVPGNPNKFVKCYMIVALIVGDPQIDGSMYQLSYENVTESHANLAEAEKAAINAAVKSITDGYPAQLEAWLQ